MNTTSQRILITGGAGFIGSHTTDILLRQGHQITILDNLSSGKLENLNLNHPELNFIEGDVLEYPLLIDLIKETDAVLHLAAISSVLLSIEDPIYTFQVNTQGFLHVLQAVRTTNRPIRLVYASSAAVYGSPPSLPCFDEEAISHLPLSPYALQKLHAENYAELYANLYQIKSLGLRYFNVYGTRQDPESPYSGVISRFIAAYREGRELTIFGDGQQSRDFISVEDVAYANVLALQGDYSGAVNVATGKPNTLLELVDYIGKAGKKMPHLQFEPARVGEIRSSFGSTRLAQEHLKFSSTIPLKEGIKLLLSDIMH